MLAPQPQAQQKLDIDLPVGAVPGDKLTFTVTAPNGQATTFSAVVPAPANLAMPMKKISVTVPVPVGYPANQQLQIGRLFLEKQIPQAQAQAPRPQFAQITPEQRELQLAVSERRVRLDQHFNRSPAAEKQECVLTFEVASFKPGLRRVSVQQQLGFWRTPRQVHHLPALGAWDAANPASTVARDLATARFVLNGISFTFALEARRVPWKHAVAAAPLTIATGGANIGPTTLTGGARGEVGGKASTEWGGEDGVGMVSGWDAELVPTLRRAPAAGAEAGGAPIQLAGLVEFGDRWSTWQRFPIGPGDAITFDLADRRSLGAIAERSDAPLKCKLFLLSGAQGALAARAPAGQQQQPLAQPPMATGAH